jgi:hypothetical protein
MFTEHEPGARIAHISPTLLLLVVALQDHLTVAAWFKQRLSRAKRRPRFRATSAACRTPSMAAAMLVAPAATAASIASMVTGRRCDLAMPRDAETRSFGSSTTLPCCHLDARRI